MSDSYTSAKKRAQTILKDIDQTISERPLSAGYGYSANDRYANVSLNDQDNFRIGSDSTPATLTATGRFGSTERKRKHELIDHLKLEIKKWKHKYELSEKDKKEVESRFGKTTLLLEEWKSKARSYELELNHLQRKFDNQVKEMTMGNHREINKMTVKYTNKIDELNNKLTHQTALNDQLKQLKDDLNQELETLREKYANAKNYANSLENRLEMSMKRATNIQTELSDKLTSMKQDTNETEMKYLATIERLTNQLKVKQSDVDFLRDHLAKERQTNAAKFQEITTRNESKIKQLQTQIGELNKQLIKIEEQKEDYARTSISATDSLNKAMEEYAQDRASLIKMQKTEINRKDKTIEELKHLSSELTDKLQSVQATKRELEQQVMIQKEELFTMKHNIDSCKSQIVHLTNELNNYKTDYESLLNRFTTNEQLNKEINQKYQLTNDELNKQTMEKNEKIEQIQQLKSDINDLSLQKNEIFIKCETAIQVNESLKNELERLRRTTVAMDKYKESTDKVERLTSELGDCYIKIKNLDKSLNDTRTDINSLSMNSVPINAYETVNKTLHKLETENVTMKHENNKLYQEKQLLISDLQELREQFQQLKQNELNLSSKLEGLTAESNALKTNNIELIEEKQQFKKKYKKIRKALDNLENMTEINEELIHTNKFLRDELTKIVSTKPIKHSRNCANPKCNKLVGTYIKINPQSLDALKTFCDT